jgi:hypothetical protein
MICLQPACNPRAIEQPAKSRGNARPWIGLAGRASRQHLHGAAIFAVQSLSAAGPATMAKRKRDAYSNGHITKAAKLAKAAGRCQEHRRITARTPLC